MSAPGWAWQPPPNWPAPPPGWTPPPGWVPPAAWPRAPAQWQFWRLLAPPAAPPDLPPPAVAATASPGGIATQGPTRKSLVWETWFVMLAFLLPSVMAAVVAFAQHVSGVGQLTRFPVVVAGHPFENMVFGILAYVPVAAVVPLALFLLARTGQSPSWLGLGRPRWKADVWPALGLIGASFGTEFALLIPLAPLFAHVPSLVSSTPIGHVPAYYVVWGLAISATTAIAEETLMSGYLLTRLSQLGWSPRRALIVSLVLRTSYHVYYGIGFILTVPFGYFVTRSFQKNRRLTRPIVAHFLFDAIIFTIAVLR